MTPLETFDGWELEEKLRHAGRILSLPTGGGCQATRAHHDRRAVERVRGAAAKLTAAALSCAAVLVTWAMAFDRADLVAPAICAAGAALVTWPASRLTHSRLA
ncbi:MAG TPA: hypothetical protein PK867_18585 [Pirellulales bacterium]|nr:hypothetical protein [Pirellulales bacterium]